MSPGVHGAIPVTVKTFETWQIVFDTLTLIILIITWIGIKIRG